MEKLCIVSGEKVWTLSVDVRIFDSGGSLPDAVALAVSAAISDVILPNVSILGSEDEGVQAIEVDPNPSNGTHLCEALLPLCVTVYKAGNSFVVDATMEETLCTQAQISVAVSQSGKVGGIQKRASGGISTADMEQMIDIAIASAKSLFAQVKSLIDNKPQHSSLPIGFIF